MYIYMCARLIQQMKYSPTKNCNCRATTFLQRYIMLVFFFTLSTSHTELQNPVSKPTDQVIGFPTLLGRTKTESRQSPPLVWVQSIWAIENLIFVEVSGRPLTTKSPAW